MEIHHLRYFLAVAHELNITRAARSLNMSVPPLSQRIRTLEHELGTRLFERSTHRTRLTADGEALLPLASSVVADFDAIPKLIKDAGQRPTVRLAIPSVLNARHRRALGDALRDLDDRFVVNLRQMPSVEMESALVSSSIDIAISHVGTTNSRLAAKVLYREPFGAVVTTRNFPGRTTLTPDDLKGLKYIQGPSHWDIGNRQSEFLNEIGVLAHADDQFSDTSGLLVYLQRTPSFAIVPLESEVVTNLDQSEFAVLPISGVTESLTTYLLRRTSDDWLAPLVAVLGR